MYLENKCNNYRCWNTVYNNINASCTLWRYGKHGSNGMISRSWVYVLWMQCDVTLDAVWCDFGCSVMWLISTCTVWIHPQITEWYHSQKHETQLFRVDQCTTWRKRILSKRGN